MAKNNANQNILEVIEIDGLIKMIIGEEGHLDRLDAKTTEQKHSVFMARQAIARFQSDELYNLRKVFE